jgi:glycolate oxidase iron-sulfur subunit
VQYGRLIGIGRQWVETTAPRNWIARVPRRLLRWLLTTPRVFKAMVAAGRCARPFLPERMRQKIPELRPARGWPAPRHARRVLVPGGCVQPTLAPAIDAAAARILDRIGITSIAVGAGSCCGAIDQHLSAEAAARRRIRANIDAWWPWIESGAEAIVVTASGCGAMIKEYGYLLRDDAAYATRAARVSAMARDMAEILSGEDVTALKTGQRRRIAFHSPCSLQHGLRLAGVTEALLGNLGYELTEVSDPHLCCGSAGTYSILQPRLADQLRANKLRGLVVGAPALIATANIGCLLHLAEKSPVPVRHWLELLDV